MRRLRELTCAALAITGFDRAGRAEVGSGANDVIDHPFALAIGPAGEADLGGGPSQLGAEISVEGDVIEHWLELEVGVQATAGRGTRELSTDLLFKKPYTLARRVSIMFGLGPQLVRVSAGASHSTSFGLEAAVDVMWWVFTDRVGLGFEPSYGLTFGPTTEQALGIVVGPIIGW